uniref:Vang-like protein n=1 Tax=Plectus sambesii TaxID=2011161 RepID=A0A914XFG0_9BILA
MYHRRSNGVRFSSEGWEGIGDLRHRSPPAAAATKAARPNRRRREGGRVRGSPGAVRISVDQDDRWADNTTAITGNTSEHSYTCEEVRGLARRFPLADDPSKPVVPMRCARYLWVGTAFIICSVAFVSPLAMVLLPKLATLLPTSSNNSNLNYNYLWTTSACSVSCEGQLLSFCFKLLFLLIGMWAVFARRAVADLPRLFVARAAVLALVVFLTFAYWLFYAVRIVQRREPDYSAIVSFALSAVDSLLFVHYLAVVLLELRHLRPEYKIVIVRSPDGHSQTITVGFLSIQRAAVDVLRTYYKDFPVYNPFLDKIPGANGNRMKLKGGGSQVSASFKLYNNIDGGPIGDAMGMPEVNAQALMMAAARRRDTGHNERFYDELEWERRVRKRRCRLISAADEAFSLVRRSHEEKGPCVPMDSHEAAQAVFPGLARSLRKFLRVTRQQPRHTAEHVVSHLAQYLRFDMSPRSFLERFFSPSETLEASPLQTKWSIICPQLVSGALQHGTVFQLRCHAPGTDSGVQLLCSVVRLPFFNLTEEVFDPKSDKFTLRLSSETSV